MNLSLMPADTDTAAALLSLNHSTAAYGLTLTPQQAQSIAVAQREAISSTGRFEFGGGAAARLAAAFCESPYINQVDYETVLRELIWIFYEFKTETGDRISDDVLIDYMRRSFDTKCRGSLELLADDALPLLLRRLNLHRSGLESMRSDDE